MTRKNLTLYGACGIVSALLYITELGITKAPDRFFPAGP
jgi:hypothetical protein